AVCPGAPGPATRGRGQVERGDRAERPPLAEDGRDLPQPADEEARGGRHPGARSPCDPARHHPARVTSRALTGIVKLSLQAPAGTVRVSLQISLQPFPMMAAG